MNSMHIRTYRHAQILPHLPILHEWHKLHYATHPWNYPVSKDEILPPSLITYANDPNSILITAEKGKDILGMLIGLPFDSPFLSHFPLKTFQSKGYDPHHLFFAGAFLLSSQLRRDPAAVKAIFAPFAAFAEAHNKPRILRLVPIAKHTPVEPWDLISPFASTGIALDSPFGSGHTLPMMFQIH